MTGLLVFTGAEFGLEGVGFGLVALAFGCCGGGALGFAAAGFSSVFFLICARASSSPDSAAKARSFSSRD